MENICGKSEREIGRKRERENTHFGFTFNLNMYLKVKNM